MLEHTESHTVEKSRTIEIKDGRKTTYTDYNTISNGYDIPKLILSVALLILAISLLRSPLRVPMAIWAIIGAAGVFYLVVGIITAFFTIGEYIRTSRLGNEMQREMEIHQDGPDTPGREDGESEENKEKGEREKEEGETEEIDPLESDIR